MEMAPGLGWMPSHLRICHNAPRTAQSRDRKLPSMNLTSHSEAIWETLSACSHAPTHVKHSEGCCKEAHMVTPVPTAYKVKKSKPYFRRTNAPLQFRCRHYYLQGMGKSWRSMWYLNWDLEKWIKFGHSGDKVETLTFFTNLSLLLMVRHRKTGK